MFENAFQGLDKKKWIDRMQPQTLMVATWLLYINGAYALVDVLDNNRYQYVLRSTSIYNLLSLIACVSLIGGPFLMANGKKLGWFLSVIGSLSPFAIRAYIKLELSSLINVPLIWVFKGQGLISFAFEAALIALLFHSMTKTYVERWLR